MQGSEPQFLQLPLPAAEFIWERVGSDTRHSLVAVSKGVQALFAAVAKNISVDLSIFNGSLQNPLSGLPPAVRLTRLTITGITEAALPGLHAIANSNQCSTITQLWTPQVSNSGDLIPCVKQRRMLWTACMNCSCRLP
jgi:hypothetical protein